jgi:hypothetical protein
MHLSLYFKEQHGIVGGIYEYKKHMSATAHDGVYVV